MQEHNLENTIALQEPSIVNEKEQNHFLETAFGKTINLGLDIGIRALLPDLIEDSVIEIKNTLLENGLQEGIQKTIDTVLDLGKSAVGVVTGKFENVEQIQNAVKKGGMIDSISNILDFTLKKTEEKGVFNKNVTNILKRGKNVVLNTISNSIEKELQGQINGVEKLNTYIKNWNTYFSEKNINGMEKEYKKIEKALKKLVPLENTLKEARKIENIHAVAKQKGGDYNLDSIELALAEKLI